MILIDGVEILTVIEGLQCSGGRDLGARTLNFTMLYNPLKSDIKKYKFSIGSKVEWKEDNKTLFFGYIEQMPYNTEDDTISITCIDFLNRLVKSNCIGRFKGTLTELANYICGIFGIQNGITSNSTHIHNIVSTGDLTYYDVIKTACESVYGKDFTLYMDGNKLCIADDNVVHKLEIGKNIRSSRFSQSMQDMVTRVQIIDNNGKVLQSVDDAENLQKFGLFQVTYNYNKDVKDNIAEAKKLLVGVTNEGEIIADNNNDCISGKYISINEPVNGFVGIFRIETDNHTIGVDSSMSLEVKYVKAG